MKAIPLWDIEVATWGLRRHESNGLIMMEQHAHRHHELLFNLSRIPMRHFTCGQTYETDTPFILYRAPYILHSSRTLSNSLYMRYPLNINPCILLSYDKLISLGRLAGQCECLIPTDESQMQRFLPLLDMLAERCHMHPTPMPDSVCAGLLATLLGMVSELVSDNPPDHSLAPSYIQEVMHYIVEHIDEDLSGEKLAARFFVSRTKLYTDFSETTHITLHEYITGIRVARAQLLLAEDIPLSHIAEQCGFSQDSAFIYMFRKKTGITPGEYRAKLYVK